MRMVVPGLYGFISACKWIERITLTTYADQDSYWTKRDWATGQVATQSDSVYALHVGRLHFNWPLRRVTLDSVLVVTDSARNARRSWPITAVHGVLRRCVISGINLPRLVLGRGLEASQVGCAEVHWDSVAPPDSASVARLQTKRPPPPSRPAPAAAQRTAAPHGAVMSFQRNLDLPRRIPTVRIGRIVFPTVAIGVVARKPSGDYTRFDLARARLLVTSVVIDPAAPQYRARPLFADGVLLRADSTEFRPDTAQMVRVGALEIDLTDSTITVSRGRGRESVMLRHVRSRPCVRTFTDLVQFGSA